MLKNGYSNWIEVTDSRTGETVSIPASSIDRVFTQGSGSRILWVKGQQPDLIVSTATAAQIAALAGNLVLFTPITGEAFYLNPNQVSMIGSGSAGGELLYIQGDGKLATYRTATAYNTLKQTVRNATTTLGASPATYTYAGVQLDIDDNNKSILLVVSNEAIGAGNYITVTWTSDQFAMGARLMYQAVGSDDEVSGVALTPVIYAYPVSATQWVIRIWNNGGGGINLNAGIYFWAE